MRDAIFISYPDTHVSLAKRFGKQLTEQLPRSTVFVAEDSVRYGDELGPAIVDTLFASDTVFVLWNENAARSRWVFLETHLAYGLGKTTITIQLKDGLAPVPEHLSNLKYLDVRRHASLDAAIAKVVAQYVATLRVFKRRFALESILTMAVRRTVSTTSENEFYRFGQKLLRERKQDSIIFKASTPILLLPGEDYSPVRREYRELLLNRMARDGYLQRATYLFDHARTRNSLTGIEPDLKANQAKMIMPLVSQSPLRMCGLSAGAPPLPSAVLGRDRGALVVRYPGTEKVVGYYFVSGRQLDSLRRRLYQPAITSRTAIVQERAWMSDLGFTARIGG